MSLASSVDPYRLAATADNPVVADVMRREVVFCLPSTPIDAIAKLMADNDMVELPVLIDRKPVGYVVSEDIVSRLAAGDVVVAGSDLVRLQPTSITARHILKSSVLRADENALMTEVIALMRQNRRQLVVVTHEDEFPVGMVTTREVADFIVRTLHTAKAQDD